MNRSTTYKIAKPITTLDELRAIIPEGEAIPLFWDGEWVLFYRNMFGNIRYQGARGEGDFRGNGRFHLYEIKVETQVPITERIILWNYGDSCKKVWSAGYKCPNCGGHVEPYGIYAYRQLLLHTVRTKFCDRCGISLRWF